MVKIGIIGGLRTRENKIALDVKSCIMTWPAIAIRGHLECAFDNFALFEIIVAQFQRCFQRCNVHDVLNVV